MIIKVSSTRYINIDKIDEIHIMSNSYVEIWIKVPGKEYYRELIQKWGEDAQDFIKELERINEKR